MLLKLLWLFLFINIASNVKAQRPIADTAIIPGLAADSLSKLCIRNIRVFGNHKTKDFVILREMHLKRGDSVLASKLADELEKARVFIYNTTLFINVTVSPVMVDEHNIDIIITVKERWYILPIPYLELADRSFNEWVEKYNASLKRLSYGVTFSHANVSGRRDRLSLMLVNGYKKHISFEYAAPYINSALTHGMRFGAGYTKTREIPYRTNLQNHLLYFDNKDFVKHDWYVEAAYTSRKKLRKKESFIVTFRHINVSDSIISHYNANYFNSSSSSQNFVDLEYKLEFDDVDNIPYPLKGYTYSLSLKKRGFGFSGGINQFSISPVYKKYFSYPHDWYSSVRLSGEIKLPFTQPYYNQQALGYKENYLRGDEFFVIDGVAFALSKLDLKKKILHFDFPTPLRSKTYQKVPFTIYLKTFIDMGYVYGQPEFKARLDNKFLYSGGFGIDVVTLYDFNFSIEYNVNQLGQKGLFLHY